MEAEFGQDVTSEDMRKVLNGQYVSVHVDDMEWGSVAYADFGSTGTDFFRTMGFHRMTFNQCSFDGLNMSLLRASHSNFYKSTFRGSSLSSSDFRDCECEGVDFSEANLEDSDFRRSNLTGANFRGAALKGVILMDATVSKESFDQFDLPTGPMVVWKATAGGLVRLGVPDGMSRVGVPTSNKIRFAVVDVLDSFSFGTDLPVDHSILYGNYMTKYTVGERVYADSLNTDWRLECTHGIHAFRTVKEAYDFYREYSEFPMASSGGSKSLSVLKTIREKYPDEYGD